MQRQQEQSAQVSYSLSVLSWLAMFNLGGSILSRLLRKACTGRVMWHPKGGLGGSCYTAGGYTVIVKYLSRRVFNVKRGACTRTF